MSAVGRRWVWVIFGLGGVAGAVLTCVVAWWVFATTMITDDEFGVMNTVRGADGYVAYMVTRSSWLNHSETVFVSRLADQPPDFVADRPVLPWGEFNIHGLRWLAPGELEVGVTTGSVRPMRAVRTMQFDDLVLRVVQRRAGGK